MVTENCDKSQAHRKKFLIQISTDIIGHWIIDKYRRKVVCTTKTPNTSVPFQYFEWISINVQVCILKIFDFVTFNTRHNCFYLSSEQTDILLREIQEKELDNPDGTHLQKLISRFTLNTICGMTCDINN